MAPKPYKSIGFGDSYGPKPYKYIGFGDSYVPKPHKFIGFGDSYVLKPYKSIGFGDSYGTKPYKFIGPLYPDLGPGLLLRFSRARPGIHRFSGRSRSRAETAPSAHAIEAVQRRTTSQRSSGSYFKIWPDF
jgi:hypothetical protein